ncbi:MAG: MoxR family ATPase [Halanaerobium sp.]|nr:MoxR family ATPase [Halanaerobium sp.]
MEKELIKKIKENIGKIMVGKDEVVDLLLTALLANGHVLIDDVPGMGKTKLANTLARTLASDFKRIQFTPDLQPADITGIYYYNQKAGDFIFRPGPILTNIVLADEINRAVPRTQSSLLEVMEERQVTVEGDQFQVSEPFMVVATQNPIELEGTFPLPEAQLDRFLLKIEMGYPLLEEEVTIMKRFKGGDPLEELQPVVSSEEVMGLRRKASSIRIGEPLLDYIAELAACSRMEDRLKLGISPRGSLALMRGAMAYALIKGRDFVLPDDIKYIFPYVIEHRIVLTDDCELRGVSKKEIIADILGSVEVPVEGEINDEETV